MRRARRPPMASTAFSAQSGDDDLSGIFECHHVRFPMPPTLTLGVCKAPPIDVTPQLSAEIHTDAQRGPEAAYPKPRASAQIAALAVCSRLRRL